jgi:hypothetical protein
MYIHLGNDVIVSFKDIIAIVGIENMITEEAQDIIDIAEVKNRLTVVGKKNKSMVVCENDVYLSLISSGTLFKRSQHMSWEEKYDD